MPRIELDTGKALNIAPPGHEKYFDPLRDYFNYSKGWSRPDDPTLQHDTQTPDHAHFQDAAAVRAGLKGKSVNDIREVVGSLIEQRIYFDFIKDRTDVLDAVSELGKVTRISDKFISLKLDGADKAIRLKGAFYESEFSVESYFENRTRETSDARASRENRFIPEEHKELAKQLEKRFTELAGGRSKYNSERYHSLERSQAEHNLSPNREPEFSPVFTTASERNSQSFEPTDTAAQSVKSSIRSIEQYEPRNSRNSQDQENPFYIKYSFSFDSSYFAYIEYRTRLRKQEQIQQHQRDAEYSRLSQITWRKPDDNNMRWQAVRPNRPELYEQFIRNTRYETTANDRERGALNEFRSSVIEDYRRRSESIEATTARARESIATHSTAISDYRAVKELHEHFKREAQRSSEDRTEISADRAESIRTNYLSKFFTNHSRELESTATNTFERFSAELTDRKPSQNFNSEYLAEFGPSRDRTAIEADDRANNQENDFSRAISTKISGINPTDLFSALDQLDQRRELQRAQERKNDRGYDSPSPF